MRSSCTTVRVNSPASCLRRAVFQRDDPNLFQLLPSASRHFRREGWAAWMRGWRAPVLARLWVGSMKLRIASLTLAIALLMGPLGGKAVAQLGWLFPGFNPQQSPQQ